VVIPKNPQAMAQRLSLHSLMFITGKRDATKLAPAVNDYVMIFQKPGEADPKVRALYDSELNPQGWVTTEEWIRWACGTWEDVQTDTEVQLAPIWDDIQELDVLDGWKSARGKSEEKHVCPLQLEVIRRCVSLYSNPGDLILDPFMGIGSTAYICMGGKTKAGHCLRDPRQAVGFELHENYFRLCNRNLEKLTREQEENKRDLFSTVEKP
jgi:DNA modification methylase